MFIVSTNWTYTPVETIDKYLDVFIYLEVKFVSVLTTIIFTCLISLFLGSLKKTSD